MVKTGVLFIVAVLVAVLTAVPGSAGVAVAVFVKTPLNPGATFPLTVMVMALPEPAGKSAFTLILLPVPLAVPFTIAVPATVAVQLLTLTAAGTWCNHQCFRIRITEVVNGNGVANVLTSY